MPPIWRRGFMLSSMTSLQPILRIVTEGQIQPTHLDLRYAYGIESAME